MNKYVIQWKSMANGRAGKGTNLFDRAQAQQLAEELNLEFPQIHHEAVKVADDPGSEESPPPPVQELSFQ